MNAIRRWLADRRDRYQRQTTDLLERLATLIHGLEGRLSADAAKFISEFASVGEWELAIDSIWQEVDDGALDLSASERVELTALTKHPSVNKNILSAGKKHLVDA